jgi:3-oxoacyl-[acyl-carrier protein] reductase
MNPDGNTTGFGGADWTPLNATYPELNGRIAVVTGAARGMGAAFAAGLTKAGVTVYGADIDGDAMSAGADKLNVDLGENSGRVIARTIDVADADAVNQLAQEVYASEGALHYWVNNAGIFPKAPLLEITREQVTRDFGVNVNGTLFGGQAAARIMKEQGRGVIVNMGSVAANRVRVNHADYCSAKAAVEHLTRSMAVEFGPHGIRVNGIGPGDIDTDMLQSLRDNPDSLATVLSGVPLGRIGSPYEVLAVLLFLLSDDARYVTGHVISVDGGSRLVR